MPSGSWVMTEFQTREAYIGFWNRQYRSCVKFLSAWQEEKAYNSLTISRLSTNVFRMVELKEWLNYSQWHMGRNVGSIQDLIVNQTFLKVWCKMWHCCLVIWISNLPVAQNVSLLLPENFFGHDISRVWCNSVICDAVNPNWSMT